MTQEDNGTRGNSAPIAKGRDSLRQFSLVERRASQLHGAIRRRDLIRVRTLVWQDRSLLRRPLDAAGHRAIHAAVRFGAHWPIITCLLEAGADPGELSDNLDNCLHQAALRYSVQPHLTLRLLEEAMSRDQDAPRLLGAARNRQGRSAMQLWTRAAGVAPEALGVCHEFYLNDAVKIYERWLKTSFALDLQNAARGGNMAAVEACIAAGAPLSAGNLHGFTPTILALRNGHVDVVRTLLEEGARQGLALFDERSMVKETSALSYAVMSGKMELVDLLLSHGACVRVVDANGVSPLVTAAYAGNMEMVQRLIKAGAAVGPRATAAPLKGLRPDIRDLLLGKVQLVAQK